MRISFLAIPLTLLASVASAQAMSTNDIPFISAQGEAIVKQPADIAWVQIAVEARGSKPEDARQQAATSMTSLMTALRRLLPSDAVKTAAFNVQPEMDYSSSPPRVRGYAARNQIEVRVDDLEKLSGVLDASVAGGATSIAGLRFDLKKRSDAEREALSLAVRDATDRAQAMANGAGKTVGGILHIQEQRTSNGPVMYRMAQGMAATRAAAPETPVAPGEIEIHAQVTLTVAIK